MIKIYKDALRLVPDDWDLPSLSEDYDALQLSLYDPSIALLRQSEEYEDYLRSVSIKAERIRTRHNARRDRVLAELRRNKHAQREKGKKAKKKKSTATAKKGRSKDKRAGLAES